MKILTIGTLLLVSGVVSANNFHYHPYEELGQKQHGDLVIQQVYSPESQATKNLINVWPNRTIPYLFEESIDENQQAIILSAMEAIQDVSCIRFIPKLENHINYVLITADASGCWSSLGMHGGEQYMNLDPRGCMQKGAVLHQLMHVLGFIHPSSRPDRDLFVKVELDNVNLYEQSQFDQVEPGAFDDFGMTYDYDSILHRSGLAFSATGQHTIIPLHEEVVLGQRETLSFKDIRKLNRSYCTLVPDNE
ncbi:zinc metalloproteinase nas-14-like [Armigeres subalbatus]|uniref:zinc metalloproteinase nas-14-like n=1 Tax=Armigeres subalbatus TaxID=124917 RepID=UPI002ED4B2DC